ncbi:hypothetical protein PR048_004355 [Dryococelus australis]|uniref:Uncharacterized protein n=1 Tax=Dryococelus australis TaxID=614101 RepID=A0ABQ9I618_9NEOP|nr:hypothetical protein PR048_004355 [Dryococelus australis]
MASMMSPDGLDDEFRWAAHGETNLVCTVKRYDGNTARLARRSDEALGVRVSVARIASSLPDFGHAATSFLQNEGEKYSENFSSGQRVVPPYCSEWKDVNVCAPGNIIVGRDRKKKLATILMICTGIDQECKCKTTWDTPLPLRTHGRNQTHDLHDLGNAYETFYIGKMTNGATVAERSTRPPRRTGFNPRPGRKWELCRTMPLVGGFSRESPVSPAPLFRRCSIFTSITLNDSRDLAGDWESVLRHVHESSIRLSYIVMDTQNHMLYTHIYITSVVRGVGNLIREERVDENLEREREREDKGEKETKATAGRARYDLATGRMSKPITSDPQVGFNYAEYWDYCSLERTKNFTILRRDEFSERLLLLSIVVCEIFTLLRSRLPLIASLSSKTRSLRSHNPPNSELSARWSVAQFGTSPAPQLSEVGEDIWAARNIEILRADDGRSEVSTGAALEHKDGRNGRSPRKPRRSATSSGTIPTCGKPRGYLAANGTRFALVGGDPAERSKGDELIILTKITPEIQSAQGRERRSSDSAAGRLCNSPRIPRVIAHLVLTDFFDRSGRTGGKEDIQRSKHPARLPPRRTGFNPRPGNSPLLRRCSILTSITLIGSQDLAVESRPYPFPRERRRAMSESGGLQKMQLHRENIIATKPVRLVILRSLQPGRCLRASSIRGQFWRQHTIPVFHERLFPYKPDVANSFSRRLKLPLSSHFPAAAVLAHFLSVALPYGSWFHIKKKLHLLTCYILPPMCTSAHFASHGQHARSSVVNLSFWFGFCFYLLCAPQPSSRHFLSSHRVKMARFKSSTFTFTSYVFGSTFPDYRTQPCLLVHVDFLMCGYTQPLREFSLLVELCSSSPVTREVCAKSPPFLCCFGWPSQAVEMKDEGDPRLPRAPCTGKSIVRMASPLERYVRRAGWQMFASATAVAATTARGSFKPPFSLSRVINNLHSAVPESLTEDRNQPLGSLTLFRLYHLSLSLSLSLLLLLLPTHSLSHAGNKKQFLQSLPFISVVVTRLLVVRNSVKTDYATYKANWKLPFFKMGLTTAGMQGRGKREIPEKNPPTSSIDRHDSHLRLNPVRPGEGEQRQYWFEITSSVVGATVAERFAHSPPTKANRAQTPSGSLDFSQVGFVPDDAVGRRVFSGISRFPRVFISVPLHIHFNQPHQLSRPRC